MLNRVPKTLFVLLTAILFTEVFISVIFSIYRSNPTNAKIKAKINIAQRSSLSYDLLIFGGSTAVGGINAKTLEKNTGLTCFNFALIGDATVAGNYFLFEDYLRFHKPPKYILFMDAYDLWHRDIGYCGVSDTLTINFPKETANLLGYSLLNYILPSQRYKYEIRALIRSKNIIAYLNGLQAKSSKFTREILENKGSSIFEEKNAPNVRKDLLNHEIFINSQKFSVSKINRNALDRFFGRAKEKNIIVFIASPPIFKEFYDYGINGEYLRSYKSFIESLPSSYDNAVLLNKDFYAVAIDKLSLSIDHLNIGEAHVFTKMLADSILKYISEKNTGVR